MANLTRWVVPLKMSWDEMWLWKGTAGRQWETVEMR